MKRKEDAPSLLLVVRWPVGGIRTFLRYTYTCPEFSNYRIGIITPSIPETKLLARDLSDRDINVIPCRPTWYAFHKSIAQQLSSKSYNLVHSHGLTSGVFASLPAKIHETPHIITLHDVFNINQFAGPSRTVKRTVLSRFLCAADTVHTISQDVQNNLCEYFPALDTRKLLAIRNGIRVQQFLQDNTRDLRQELGLADHDFLIGFLGRFMAQKGFRYLVEAIQSLAVRPGLPMRPIVVAVGQGGFIREEQSHIADLGLADYFRFLPFVENAGPTLSGLDVLAIPSLWEACPLLPMEAFVCGVPVIASKCIGLREVIADTPATVIPPADSAALAEALYKHMNSTTANDEAKRFVVEASRRFDVRNAASRLDALYRNFCAGSFAHQIDIVK